MATRPPAPKAPPPPLPDLSGHMCRAPGCRRFGCYGYGPAGLAGMHLVRWWCPRHRTWGQEDWDEARGVTRTGLF